MTPELAAFVRRELSQPLPAAIRVFAQALAKAAGARAALFYGSVLRTGDLAGVLDFYLLTETPPRQGLDRWLWPRVG